MTNDAEESPKLGGSEADSPMSRELTSEYFESLWKDEDLVVSSSGVLE